jgi:hypothetical protein
MERGGLLCEVIGAALGEERYRARDEFEPKIIALENRIKELEHRVLVLETANSFEERFNKLANEVKHGTEIPQSELLATATPARRRSAGTAGAAWTAR